jgi:predicted NBD/HSP70 family sugar kinase
MKSDHKSTATARYVLCVHIGASSRHVAILDENGEVLLKNQKLESPKIRKNLDYKELLADAVDALTSLVKRAVQEGMDANSILGGGAIVPGSVNPETGYVGLLPALPGLRNCYLAQDLTAAMERVLARKVAFWVENDANGWGLSEQRFGNGKGIKDFLVVIVCTGLGGALFLNGALYHGHTQRAGEIGHTTVLPDGPLCACGSRGCLETMASGGAILKAILHSKSPLRARENLTYQEVIDAAESGDQDVIGILNRMGHYLGIGLANMVNTLNPAKLILCGQVNKASRFFQQGMEEEMSHREFQGTNCELVISDRLDDMEIQAALATFLNYSTQRT